MAAAGRQDADAELNQPMEIMGVTAFLLNVGPWRCPPPCMNPANDNSYLTSQESSFNGTLPTYSHVTQFKINTWLFRSSSLFIHSSTTASVSLQHSSTQQHLTSSSNNFKSLFKHPRTTTPLQNGIPNSIPLGHQGPPLSPRSRQRVSYLR